MNGIDMEQYKLWPELTLILEVGDKSNANIGDYNTSR